MISVAIIIESQRHLLLFTNKVYNLLYLLWLLRLLKHWLDVNRRLDTCLNLRLSYSKWNLFLARLLLKELICCFVCHWTHSS
jgi:hypothetical protein